MNTNEIKLVNVMGSEYIDIETPIIVANIGPEFLISVDKKNNIYRINMKRIYDVIQERVEFIYQFTPVSHIKLRNYSPKQINVLLANKRLIPHTTSFQRVGKTNDWYGIIKKRNTIAKSLGTFRSLTKPSHEVPVFLSKYIKEYNSDTDVDFHIHTNKKYGNWTINKYAFELDTSKINMIGPTGTISKMFIPVTPHDLQLDTVTGKEGKFNRKTYFTAQGNIVSSTNCVAPTENMNKMTLNECNSVEVAANDDGSLSLNETISGYSDIGFNDNHNKNKNHKNNDSLVLKEKDEPWYLNHNIIGNGVEIANPHKVTGTVNSLRRGLGTVYGDSNEINSPFITDCKLDNVTGHSRLHKHNRCLGIEGFDGDNEDIDDNVNYNNYIVLSLCIIILFIIYFRK